MRSAILLGRTFPGLSFANVANPSITYLELPFRFKSFQTFKLFKACKELKEPTYEDRD